MSAGRVLTRMAVAIVLGGALGALSQIPYAAERGEHAVLRLSWRSRGMTINQCRQLTEEELAEIPAHMRQEEVCEGRSLAFLLLVRLNDAVIVQDTIRPAGAHADRPLYVFRELEVEPGRYAVEVRFAPVEAVDSTVAVEALSLADSLDLRSGDVGLVVRNRADGVLRLNAPERGQAARTFR